MFKFLPILLLLFFASENLSDPFVLVLNRLNDPELEEKLVLFELRGVERTVNSTDFNVDKVLKYARSFRGTPHRMGGTTKRGIDCSGLVKVVFEKYGVKLPHSALEQARYGKLIADENDLKKGDLVFFCKSYKTTKPITHSGIYAGNGEFIHTSSSSGVTISPLSNPFWHDRFLFGTRLNP